MGAAGDIREQILSEATRLFAANGFEGTSLRGVAEAVGIRKPSILYHFPSKDELRRGVLEKVLTHWNEVLPRLLIAATSGEGRFDAVVEETVRFFAEEPDRARLITRELLDRPKEMKQLMATHVRQWVEAISAYIRQGQAEGRIHADVDPEAYVIHVMGLVVGIPTAQGSLAAVLPRGERAGERHVKELLRIAKCSLFIPSGSRRSEASSRKQGKKR